MKTPKSARLKLIVQSGSQKGKEFTFENGDEIVIGRGRYANLSIHDKQASRRHARIYAENRDLFIEDLDSINGTFVNGRSVKDQKLAPNDAVEITNLRLLVCSTQDDTVYLTELAQPAPGFENLGETQVFLLSRQLKEDTLFNTIEHLVSEKKTGTIIVQVSWDTGRIFLREGRIMAASLGTP